MRTTIFANHGQKRGFMTAQELQKTRKSKVSPSVDRILAKLKYRLSHPRFLEDERSVR
jgi:hypothetical protein